MSCSIDCKTPTPAQAHCGSCHETFGGVRGFDTHRVNGACVHPTKIGMKVNARGVWSWPITDEMRAQLAAIS